MNSLKLINKHFYEIYTDSISFLCSMNSLILINIHCYEIWIQSISFYSI